MMRILTNTLALLLFSFILSKGAIAAEDPKPLTTAHPAQAYLPQSCYHTGRYQQLRHIEGLQEPVESVGEFVFSCKNGLIWHTQSPLNETILYPLEGKSSKIHQDRVEELDGRLHKHLGKLLNAIIGAEYAYLDKHFKMASHDDTLTLQPTRRRMKKFISSVNIQKQADATQISLLGKSAFNTEIKISETKEFQALDAQTCQAQFAESALACKLLFK